MFNVSVRPQPAAVAAVSALAATVPHVEPWSHLLFFLSGNGDITINGNVTAVAALAQIATPSAAHFLKSHQLLVQKFAADRDRQKDRVSLSSPRHLSAPVPYVAMVSGMHAVRRQIRFLFRV